MRKKWSDLSPTTQRTVMVLGAIDAALKVAALADLARRPAAGVRGRKAVWATAITVINSAGVVPVLYFVKGRK